MRRLRFLFIFAVLVSIIHCVTSPYYLQKPLEPNIQTVKIDKKTLMARLPPALPPRIRKAEASDNIDSNCRFESIPGAFYGHTNKQPFNEYKIKGTEILIDLNPSVFYGKLEISTLRVNPGDAKIDLKLKPSNVRFAMVATMCNKYFSGFVNDKPSGLSLMYFDRAVIITGEISDPQHFTRFDLNIPGPGFYFVEYVIVDDKNSYTKGYYEGLDIYYGVMLK